MPDRMKTYVVIAWTFRAQAIECLFSTPEKAERFMVNNPAYGDAAYRIEEHTLDECEHYTPKTVWRCGIGIETGEIVVETILTRPCGTQYAKTESGSLVAWGDSSTSKEHARKLALEKHQEILLTRRENDQNTKKETGSV